MGKVGRGGEERGEGRGAGEKGRERSSPNVRDALTPLYRRRRRRSGITSAGRCLYARI